MDVVWSLIAVATVLLCVYILNQLARPKNFPPGENKSRRFPSHSSIEVSEHLRRSAMVFAARGEYSTSQEACG